MALRARHPRPRLRRRRRLGARRSSPRRCAATTRDPDRRHAATLAVLQHARLLVPVVAVLGEVEYDEQRAGARQDLGHGDGADARPRRPQRAAGVHQHRGAAPLEPRGATGPGAGAPGPPRPRSRTTRPRCWSTSPGPVLFVVETDDLARARAGPRAGRGQPGARAAGRQRPLRVGDTGPVSFSPGPSPGASGTSEASRNASCRLRRPSRSGAAWW